eukprot:5030689-Pleurochrysis_carterae.AAC.1
MSELHVSDNFHNSPRMRPLRSPRGGSTAVRPARKPIRPDCRTPVNCTLHRTLVASFTPTSPAISRALGTEDSNTSLCSWTTTHATKQLTPCARSRKRRSTCGNSLLHSPPSSTAGRANALKSSERCTLTTQANFCRHASPTTSRAPASTRPRAHHMYTS